MKYHYRLLLVLFLTLTFIIITPTTILLSEGYRFDLKQKRLVQTGAIYLKTNPAKVNLFLNKRERQFKKPTFIYSGILIKNLIPNTYKISITASTTQFQWTKNLPVEPLLVTKATRILLPFDTPAISTSSEFATTTPSLLLPIGEDEILYTTDKRTIYRFRKTSTEPEFVFSLENISSVSKNETIQEIKPSLTEENLLVITNSKVITKHQNKVSSLEATLNKILVQTKTKLSHLSFFWHPTDNSLLFVLSKQQLFILNLNTNEYTMVTPEKIMGINLTKDGSYFLTTTGNLYHFDRKNPNRQSLIASLDSSQFIKTELYKIYPIKENLFLFWNTGGNLLLFESSTNQLSQIDKNVRLLKFSNDESRIAYVTDNKAFVYFLTEVFDDNKYEKYENIPIYEKKDSSDLITDLYFANNNWYLLTIAGNIFTISEIDKRQPINSWAIKLPSLKTPIGFNIKDNFFIWADDNRLYSAKLMP